MTLRSDHIAGGVFVAFGLLVFALSGDLPFGTLSFPGAGMMPKLLAGFLISFALLLILRANESAPLATIPWGDLPHAARVVAVIAAAIALYQTLGFVLTMAFLLLALTFVIERRNLFVAAGFSIGVVALTYFLFAVALKTPLEPFFDNQDANVPHNVAIYRASAATNALFRGTIVTGPRSVVYHVPALQPGSYFFRCDVHPQMKGTLVVRGS